MQHITTGIALLFAPVIFATSALLSAPAGISADLVGILSLLTSGMAVISLIAYVVVNARIDNDPPQAKILRFYTLLGRTIRQRELSLSRFDRISLHRGFRGGYWVSLLGRDKEIQSLFHGRPWARAARS